MFSISNSMYKKETYKPDISKFLGSGLDERNADELKEYATYLRVQMNAATDPQRAAALGEHLQQIKDRLLWLTRL